MLVAIAAFVVGYEASYWTVTTWPLVALPLIAVLGALSCVVWRYRHIRIVRLPLLGLLAGGLFGCAYSLLLSAAVGGF